MSSQIDGGYLDNFATLSPDVVNSKMITRVGGSVVPTLTPTWPGQIVTIIADGAGWSKDTAIMRNHDDSDWIGIGGGKHKHDADTDPAGGRIDDILRANMARFVWVDETNPVTSKFAMVGTGTTANEVTQARIRLSTGTVQNNYVHASRSGAAINYGRRINFQYVGYITAGTQVSAKIGVNMEDVNIAHNPDRKFGLEVCDSASVARNWDLVSASGAVRDIVATTEAAAQTTNKGFIMQHRPGLNVRFWVNGALVATNPNNVSASGSGSGQRNVSFGIKTNNTTENHMYCRLVQLIGSAGEMAGTWFNLADP